MKKALITGIRGQDGAYLSKFLIEKGYEVYGADRRSSESGFWRLKELGLEKQVKIIYMDLLEYTNIVDVVKKLQPDEVYNLAAQSFVKTSFDQPIFTAEIDAIGVLRVLEALRYFKPDARFYQASTSEMFGKVQATPQDERTMFYPRSPYSVSKLFGHWITINYRESYNMFCCSGILFNHESPLRGFEFVTKKITSYAAKIKYGMEDKLVLGNLDSKRDWGYAPEYVNAMWLMLQQDKPDDYIVATGETHSVKEFTEKAFNATGIDIVWDGQGVDAKGHERKTGKVLVEVSPEFYRPAEVDILTGDPAKAKKMLGWSPKTKFEDIVKLMVEADIESIKKSLK
ncbi:MAG: GDP-mannose 4,6-dehydratase [Deltaproteobacteria bacterium]|nr:GDP-mannose 4,6-dehydratase [Deltaproteobacteria bacterium]